MSEFVNQGPEPKLPKYSPDTGGGEGDSGTSDEGSIPQRALTSREMALELVSTFEQSQDFELRSGVLKEAIGSFIKERAGQLVGIEDDEAMDTYAILIGALETMFAEPMSSINNTRLRMQLMRLNKLIDPDFVMGVNDQSAKQQQAEEPAEEEPEEELEEEEAEDLSQVNEVEVEISNQLDAIYNQVEATIQSPPGDPLDAVSTLSVHGDELAGVNKKITQLLAKGEVADFNRHLGRIASIRNLIQENLIIFFQTFLVDVDSSLKDLDQNLVSHEQGLQLNTNLRQDLNNGLNELSDSLIKASQNIDRIKSSFQDSEEAFQKLQSLEDRLKNYQERFSRLHFRLWKLSFVSAVDHFNENKPNSLLNLVSVLRGFDVADINSYPLNLRGRDFSTEDVVNLLTLEIDEARQQGYGSIPVNQDDATYPDYRQYVDVLLEGAEEELRKVKELVENTSTKEKNQAQREEEFAKIEKELEQQLSVIDGVFTSGRIFPITADTNGVEERFAILEQGLRKLKEFGNENRVKEIEVLVQRHKFEAYWKVAIALVDAATNNDKSLSQFEKELDAVYDSRIYPAMSEIVLRLGGDLGERAEAALLKSRIEVLKERVMSNWALLASFENTKQDIVGNRQRRAAPSELTPGKFPLDRDDMAWVINSLIRTEYEGGKYEGGNNPTLGQKEVELTDFFGTGEVEFAYQESAVSWCMNLIRKIFDGSVPDAVNSEGVLISTSNLHTSEGSLIDYVFSRLKEHMNNDPSLVDKIPMISRTMVRRAYQLVVLLTGDHSALASSSVMGMSDQIYYAYHAPEHLAKYASQGRTDANLLPIFSITTFDGSFSPIRDIYLQNRALKVENKLNDSGALNPSPEIQKQFYETFGRTNLSFLLNSLIAIPNVAKGNKPQIGPDANANGRIRYIKNSRGNATEYTDDVGEARFVPRITTQFLASPLRAIPAKLNQREYQGGRISFDGDVHDKGAVQMRPMFAEDQSNPTITLDDFQDVDQGEIPFSAIDWSVYAGQFSSYWDNLAKNGKFLIDLLMGNEESFVKSMGDVASLGNQENQINYAVSLLIKAAPELHSGVGRVLRHPDNNDWKCPWSTMITNGVLVRLILARVMLLSEKTGRGVSEADREINRYISAIAEEELFGNLGKDATSMLLDAIQTIAKEGRGWSRAKMKFGEDLQNQLKERFKVS